MSSPIPPQESAFVGRSTELALLRPRLAEPGLLTLTGPGGVGKTRLAAHLAATLSGEPGSPPAEAPGTEPVSWAHVWQLRDGRLLAAAVAEATGLSDHTPRLPAHALAEWIGDRRLLLVLDSCEHLVPACRELVRELLAACAGLTVLATSREQLGVPGESVHEVGPLPPDTEALELFLDRAATAGAPLVRPAELAAAATACRLLEGVPLALELAAAQLPQQPVATLAARLRARRDLTTGPEEVPRPRSRWDPPRLRALRTTIGWSHELCTPAERLLWARMSVFRAETGAAVLRAVCGGGPLEAAAFDAALEGLRRKSVVGVTADGRYRMLDTVREYGAMWLDELGEREKVARRHAHYHLGLVREADRTWFGPAQLDAYRTLGQGHADICAALSHLRDSDPGAALELAALAGFFWACCGRLHEAGHHLAELVAHTRAPAAVQARALWALGIVRALQGDYAAASDLAHHSRTCAELSGEEDRLLDAAYLRGVVLLLQGNPEEAGAHCARALDGPAGSPARRARCRLVGVFALTASGRLDEAGRAAELLRAACERRGEYWTRAYADHQLALSALLSGRPAEAAACARRMIAGKHALGDAFGVALGLDLLAAGLAGQGRANEAATVNGTAYACWRTVGHPQRGTPELAPLREHAERTARARIGDREYARAFRAAAHGTPAAAVRLILATGP
ncbi:tetratricopeptide repeat protein [Streptomyces sp. WAC07149]|uniref:ATP-binding protein n=1 Tax=Streptomyces sp. WAC07149 TaxID=2487425 RepID=UPI000F7A87AC|nr:tetratricopeptide repeat protein [Streptomyces sp. WAC07149]RST08878.1 tetratricopeptide repeat protein [Streptomyces sp. WAC07149]